MWSWHEETAQRFHEHPADINGYRELKAQLRQSSKTKGKVEFLGDVDTSVDHAIIAAPVAFTSQYLESG